MTMCMAWSGGGGGGGVVPVPCSSKFCHQMSQGPGGGGGVPVVQYPPTRWQKFLVKSFSAKKHYQQIFFNNHSRLFLGGLSLHLNHLFKFTLKPPIVRAIGNLQLAIWDTSFWNNFVKFGHRTP